jgi:predicted RNA polymerase sigma factor
VRSVLQALYLLFNEGYTSSSGKDLHRAALSTEAIRLCRALHSAVPDEPEVAGLLALMLLTDARRPARTGPGGEIVPLADQDRTRWDRDLLDEGVALLTATLPRGAVGPYQLQAAIAAVHDEAPTAADTDWAQILVLYGLLEQMQDNPVVTLNRAIAAAMVHGPAYGLKILAGLDERLAGHHRLPATRAHLLELGGDTEEAIAQYRTAATLTASAPERDYLLTRAARLAEAGTTRREQPATR